MRKAISLLLFIVFGVTTVAAQAPQGEQPKKPIRMGIGRTVTFPLRHPIKTQKGIAKAAKKTAQTIW
jgi:hypothetical protein